MSWLVRWVIEGDGPAGQSAQWPQLVKASRMFKMGMDLLKAKLSPSGQVLTEPGLSVIRGGLPGYPTPNRCFKMWISSAS